MAGKGAEGGKPEAGKGALTLMTLWAFILVISWITIALIMVQRGWFYGA